MKSHQDLLDAYVEAKLSLIDEYSGNFVADWRQLVADIERYASTHGLHTACLDEVRADIAADALYGGES